MNDLDWWDPVHAMFLAITANMPEEQQLKIKETLQGLARLREEKGEIQTANFLHALADDDRPDPRPPNLKIVK